MFKAILISLAVILFLPNLFHTTIYSEDGYDLKEQYDPALDYINSVDKLDQHFDSVLALKKIAIGSFESVFEMSTIISKRFYHGYSHFALNENWIVAIGGKLTSSGIGCKVQPDKILLHPNAACSQQAIVMMALLRKKGITNRHLAFPHHYTLDVLINGKWYFFDPNKEPEMNKEQRSADGWKYNSDSLTKYYGKSRMAEMRYAMGNGSIVQKGSINEIPAPNARIFQATTHFLSKSFWCFPLFLLFLRSGKYFPFNKKGE